MTSFAYMLVTRVLKMHPFSNLCMTFSPHMVCVCVCVCVLETNAAASLHRICAERYVCITRASTASCFHCYFSILCVCVCVCVFQVADFIHSLPGCEEQVQQFREEVRVELRSNSTSFQCDSSSTYSHGRFNSNTPHYSFTF